MATLGPASASKSSIEALIHAGVDVFRINFSHGTHEQKEGIIDIIKDYNKANHASIGIMADLQGPKIRFGAIEGNSFPVKAGDKFVITTDDCIGTPERVRIHYETFPADVQPGDTLLVDDGKVELAVLDTDRKRNVTVRVLNGDSIGSNKGVNLPDTHVSVPSLTEKDVEDLIFAIGQEVDWVALSFVRSEKDIQTLRDLIHKHTPDPDTNHHAKIVAKIEKPQAVENIDRIIDATDAVMMARGDLGVEMPLEKVPIIQKQIVQKCLEKSKPVIIATQMMESMIENNKPTRAEVTDVANAIFDGADVVMLSGETAVGRHPARVVETMQRIISEVEEIPSIYFKSRQASPDSPIFIHDAVCYAACDLAQHVNATAIMGLTRSGYTAYMCSSCRPMARIYVFTDNKRLLTRLSLVWGVKAFYYDRMVGTDETMEDLHKILKQQGHVDSGDVVVNMATMPLEKQGRTNMMKVTRIN